MKVSTVLVTGGCGFVGSHLVEELVGRGIETYVLDNFSTGSLENIRDLDQELVHVVRGEIRDVKRLMPRDAKVDVVFHEAAIASVPRSVNDPMFVHDINVNMSLDLMNYCVAGGIRKFIFASSAAVYGFLGQESARETMACRPASPYGAGKLAIENYLHSYQEAYGLAPVLLRYFNIYGPRQKFSDYSGVITIFGRSLLSGLSPTIRGDGRQTRDFVNVKDVVQANMLAMDSESAIGEVFNVATGKSISILRLYGILNDLTGKDLKYKTAPSSPGDVKRGDASIDKIKRILGYKPRVTLKNGLAELLEYMKETEMKSAPPPILEA
jgi:nucleoside-diphosphate-sugar epimerase